MLTSLIYIASFVLVLSLIVVIHEGGHFFMARWCGVHVTDFSVGFGREIFSRVDKKGTRWKLCLIPLGGYVKMLGDTDAASAQSSTEGLTEEEKKKAFLTQKLWKRALIIFAGPGMNYLFAILLLTGIFFSVGEAKLQPVIGTVIENSPAAEAGMQPGDRFVEINNQKVSEFSDVIRLVRLTEFEKPLDILFERDGVMHRLSLKPRYVDGSEYPMIGFSASAEHFEAAMPLSLGASALKAVQSVWNITADTTIYLGQVLFQNRSPKDMRGPLGIAEMSGDAVRGGWLSLLMFIVQISVAVGFMNLLPIPVLDGGHLAFYAVEAVRGKPLPDRAQNAFLVAGLSVLLVLLAYTMLLDVPRIVQRIFG
ncbi:MAG: RIP metalloprotease RseP [Alphaproteobacteria bacterium]|nr:RIP metalloprotease RseP [Alphaproteobacteria bacterium]